MKKTASKVAEPAQIQPKSQILFHKNLPPRDFSLMTLRIPILLQFANVMDRDQIAEAVMMKENVLARRLILLGTSVITVIWNPIGFQSV